MDCRKPSAATTVSPLPQLARRGISQLSAWWIKLGIVVERIDLARPDQNSRHERMHRTLKNETASPPCASLAPQQAAFDRFRRIFNHQRPHEALGQVPPATVYQKSKTKYPAKLLRFTYPFATICLVGSDGCIRWPQGKIFISSSLSGEAVGVQRLDERYAEVLFGPITIGLLDCSQLHRGLLRPRVDGRRERFVVSTMSPVAHQRPGGAAAHAFLPESRSAQTLNDPAELRRP